MHLKIKSKSFSSDVFNGKTYLFNLQTFLVFVICSLYYFRLKFDEISLLFAIVHKPVLIETRSRTI